MKEFIEQLLKAAGYASVEDYANTLETTGIEYHEDGHESVAKNYVDFAGLIRKIYAEVTRSEAEIVSDIKALMEDGDFIGLHLGLLKIGREKGHCPAVIMQHVLASALMLFNGIEVKA